MTNATVDRAHRPALAMLHEDQADALDRFREGFADRRAVIEWLHDFAFLSLGRADTGLYPELCTRDALLAVVSAADRADATIDDEAAGDERRRLVARYLRPACRLAYRDLRGRATEYLDEGAPRADRNGAIALRPALDEYRTRQARAIAAFLDGFDARPAAERWSHRLDQAFYGAMQSIEPDFDRFLLHGPVEQRTLLGDAPRYRTERERLAARFLLPAANVSVRELAVAAGETADTDGEPVEVAQL